MLEELVKRFLTKDMIKKFANPIVDYVAQKLMVEAKKTVTNVDDASVLALANAAKSIIAAW